MFANDVAYRKTSHVILCLTSSLVFFAVSISAVCNPGHVYVFYISLILDVALLGKNGRIYDGVTERKRRADVDYVLSTRSFEECEIAAEVQQMAATTHYLKNK
ncbi:hypothetical protein AVEN_70124-1 [Araneus ventricosus]|uniref:Uncharacterized protein n=1 Tax=Araneus ventricosus TaxID=182803 RepID=A0A4Y2EH98_ARAVE|nr:hypothetical protein AVEN_70124-1 [Araneus ventricosus]